MRHIVITLSVRHSRFVSGANLLYSLRVELPNLVCGCILGWRSVAYHFRVNVTLTSNLLFNYTVRPSVPLCVRCISPIVFEVGITNLLYGYILEWRSVANHFWVTVTLTSDLVFRIIVSGAYLLYYLRE